MSWTVQRYILLAGGGTIFDPDPITTQPGEFALDGLGAEIPVMSITGGIAWGDAIVVDESGAPVPPGSLLVDIGFVKRTVSPNQATTGGQPRSAYAWNRGVFATTQSPGIEISQTGLESPAMVSLVVISGVTVPAAPLRLALRIWRGQR